MAAKSDRWIAAHIKAVNSPNTVSLLHEIINGKRDDPLNDYVTYLIVKSHISGHNLYPILEPLCSRLTCVEFPTWFELFADLGYRIKADDAKLIASISKIIETTNDVKVYNLAARLGYPISHNNFSAMRFIHPHLHTISEYLSFMIHNIYIPYEKLFNEENEVTSIISLISGLRERSNPVQMYERPFIEKLQAAINEYKSFIKQLYPKYNIISGLTFVREIIMTHPRGSLKVMSLITDMIDNLTDNT